MARTRPASLVARGALVAVLGAVALAGCGASGGTEAAPTTAPTPVATTEAPAATTTIDASSPDAEQYLDLVTKPNCTVAEFNEADQTLTSNNTVQEAMDLLQPIAAKVADVYDEFAERLGDAEWSEVVQPAVDDVYDEIVSQAALFRAMADASTPDDFEAAYSQLYEQVTSGDNPAGRLRSQLGLPSNLEIDEVTCSRAA